MNKLFTINTSILLGFLLLLSLSKIGKAQENGNDGNIETERRDTTGSAASGVSATQTGWLDDAVSSVANAAKIAAENINTAKNDVSKAINDGSLKKAIQSGLQSVSQALNNSIQAAKSQLAS